MLTLSADAENGVNVKRVAAAIKRDTTFDFHG
jgi:hypothetical protein